MCTFSFLSTLLGRRMKERNLVSKFSFRVQIEKALEYKASKALGKPCEKDCRRSIYVLYDCIKRVSHYFKIILYTIYV